jgi:hypothetical protein
MARRKRKSNNPAGRPVTVGGDSAAVVVPVRLPESMRDEVDAAAARLGIERSAWLRMAVMAALLHWARA